MLSPWVGRSRMEKCLSHQYLQVLWSCSSSTCPATSCSMHTFGGHRGVWDHGNRAVPPLPQVAVRWDDSLSLPNRCLRKLGSGQVPVPIGCRPQSLQDFTAWRSPPPLVIVKRFTACSVVSLPELRLPLAITRSSALSIWDFSVFTGICSLGLCHG